MPVPNRSPMLPTAKLRLTSETHPKRGPGTLDDFLKRHAKTMWQCDFFSKKVVSATGLRDLFALDFLHVESWQVFISPAAYNPDEAWVLEQAEAF